MQNIHAHVIIVMMIRNLCLHVYVFLMSYTDKNFSGRISCHAVVLYMWDKEMIHAQNNIIKR